MKKLYHGTNLSSAFNIFLHGVDLDKSLNRLDFGKGFYLTDDRKKAIRRALKKTADYNNRYKCNESAYIVEVYLNEDMLKNVNYKKFELRETAWFEFVINNRLSNDYLNFHNIYNHNKDNKYDIVCGEIADSIITKVADDIENNLYGINDVDYSDIIPDDGRYYGCQYSLHTEKALDCIEIGSCDIIKTRRSRK